MKKCKIKMKTQKNADDWKLNDNKIKNSFSSSVFMRLSRFFLFLS